MKLKKKYRYIIYKLSDDNASIVIQKTAESATYDEFVAALPPNECRYAIFDFEYEKPGEGQRQKICFYAWYVMFSNYTIATLYRSPDTSKIKAKMLYASSKDALRKKLVGVATEIQATDLSEVAYDVVLDKVSKSASLSYITYYV